MHMDAPCHRASLDSGTTTTAAIARALRHHENLTIRYQRSEYRGGTGRHRPGPERIAKRPRQLRPSARSSCLIRFSCSTSGHGCPSLLPSAERLPHPHVAEIAQGAAAPVISVSGLVNIGQTELFRTGYCSARSSFQ